MSAAGLLGIGPLAWAHPWAFALLPLAGWLAWRARRGDDPASVRLVHTQLHGALHAPLAPPTSRRGLFAAGAFACWVVALAQPQRPGAWQLPPARGRDVVVLLDTTLSMTLHDLRWDGRPAERLAVVKQVFARFVDSSPGDRFGVIAYGAHAATLLPPTLDRRVAVRVLMRARPDLLGDGGCLGDAMALALRQVRSRAGLAPVLVLYSDDGSSRGGHISPAQSVALARSLGVRVFAVQVGGKPADARPYRVPAFDAPQPDLAEIARLTHGQYFYAASPGAQRRAVQAIARLAPTLQPPPRRGAARQEFAWPLLAGALLLVASEWLPEWPPSWRRGRSRP